MGQVIQLVHVGTVVQRHLCDQHLLELMVRSERTGVHYLCQLEHCHDKAYMTPVGKMVEIVEPEEGSPGHPYYIQPLPC